jgi:Predicted extracellular endo alpha-1,4 polygalactosaminidase or related polysaccharide hydrolase
MNSGDDSRKARLRRARTYTVYYGAGRETEISRYDVGILEPAGHESGAVGRLQESGTLTLAYLSAIETNKNADGFSMLREEDFILRGGVPMMNAEYGNRIAKLHSERWQAVLTEKIADLLLNQGYDGLFLDTLADLDYFVFTGAEYGLMVNAAVKLLRGLRLRFPDRLVVQNNGLQSLYRFTVDFLDGICWENPDLFGNPKAIEKHLKQIAAKRDLRFFLLMNRENEKMRAMAQKNGHLYCQCESYT